MMVCALTFCVYAQATDLKVNCNGAGALSTINGALKLLNPVGPNTVIVSGSCKENIVIQGFDRLTLIANPGASITDASNGNNFVILVSDSQRITIQGFTVNGRLAGIRCDSYSLCRFSGNTIQGSTGDGVEVARSRAEFSGDIMQNNGRGLLVTQGGEVFTSQVTIRGSGAAGVRLIDASFLIAAGTVVQNSGGNGIRLTDHSTLRSDDNTITGNGANGISVEGGSEARFVVDVTGTVVTGNAGHGVSVNDLSFASFESPGNDISGNTTQPDVACNPQFSAERGALPTSNIGGGTTNCTEP
jgi:hypothetical protein